MTPEFRRFLLAQAVVGAGINFFLNGTIGWLLYRSLPRIPLDGDRSITGDIVGTSVLLPLLICLIATPLIRRDVQRGRVPAGVRTTSASSPAARLPRPLLLRALSLGALGFVIVAPASIWFLRIIGLDGLDLWPFVGFKASFAAALAAVITPVVAARALAETPSGVGAPAPS